MIIYAIIDEEYEDSRVTELFFSNQKAEKYCEGWNREAHKNGINGCWIKSYETADDPEEECTK